PWLPETEGEEVADALPVGEVQREIGAYEEAVVAASRSFPILSDQVKDGRIIQEVAAEHSHFATCPFTDRFKNKK
ncbi:MAG: hypothetical protein ACRDGM_04240, partial [bacterium]